MSSDPKPPNGDNDLALVVAVAENGVIGRNGDLPWRLPDELRYFKRLTVGHTLIMGRKTFESIGRPLPRRRSLVLTRDAGFAAEGIETAQSLDQALAMARRSPNETGDQAGPNIFVVGGSSVYRLALPRARHLFLTRVHAEPDGDTFFRPISDLEWKTVASEHHAADDRHAHAFTMEHLRRPADG